MTKSQSGKQSRVLWQAQTIEPPGGRGRVSTPVIDTNLLV